MDAPRFDGESHIRRWQRPNWVETGEREKGERVQEMYKRAFKAWIWKYYEKNWMGGMSFSFSYILQLVCCSLFQMSWLTWPSLPPFNYRPKLHIFVGKKKGKHSSTNLAGLTSPLANLFDMGFLLQNAAEKPPPFMPSWTAMYVINAFVVVWVLVVGFGFGGWASMTNFVRQVDTFGLFAKCYQCKPPAPPAAAPPHHRWVSWLHL